VFFLFLSKNHKTRLRNAIVKIEGAMPVGWMGVEVWGAGNTDEVGGWKVGCGVAGVLSGAAEGEGRKLWRGGG
jgi:hypothetical protein